MIVYWGWMNEQDHGVDFRGVVPFDDGLLRLRNSTFHDWMIQRSAGNVVAIANKRMPGDLEVMQADYRRRAGL